MDSANRKSWLGTLFCMILILGLSSIPSKGLPKMNIPCADKAVHVTLYTGLGLSLSATNLPALGVWAIGSTFGALDENYQRLTPGRSCDPKDWVADMVGIGLGFLAVRKLKLFSK